MPILFHHGVLSHSSLPRDQHLVCSHIRSSSEPTRKNTRHVQNVLRSIALPRTLLQHCHCPFQACAPILGAILRTSQLPARPCSMKRIEALTFKKKVSLHFYAAALHTHQMLLIHSQLVCPLWTFQTPQGLGMFPGYSPTVNSFNFICTPFPGSCARPQQKHRTQRCQSGCVCIEEAPQATLLRISASMADCPSFLFPPPRPPLFGKQSLVLRSATPSPQSCYGRGNKRKPLALHMAPLPAR